MNIKTRRIKILGIFGLLITGVMVISASAIALLVMLGRTYGVLANTPIEVSSNAIVTAVLGITGLVGVGLAYNRAVTEDLVNKAKFIFYINQSLLQDDQERRFFYKLDHNNFTFDPQGFPGSDDEQQLDSILRKISYVGKLVRDGVIDIADVKFVRHIVDSVLADEQVLNYLEWLSNAARGNQTFADAVYLFEEFSGNLSPHHKRLTDYLKPRAQAQPLGITGKGVEPL